MSVVQHIHKQFR